MAKRPGDFERSPATVAASAIATLPCPYRPGWTAEWRILVAETPLAGPTLDRLFAAGYRRQGPWFYRPECRGCSACVALRVPAAEFRPSRSQRRCLARTSELSVALTPISAWSARHSALLARYLEHRHQLEPAPEAITRGLLAEGIDSTILELRQGSALLAAMVVDWGEVAASAVYAFYEPEASRLGLGTASILNLIRLARSLGREWVYLGLWLKDHPKMHYKIRFRPHERRIAGVWQRFGEAS